MPAMTPSRFGFGALVVASVLWGTTGTAASFMPDSVNPVAIGASTMTIGGLLLLLVALRGSVAAFRDPAARRWLLIGACGVFVYPIAFYSAMSQAGVAIGNVVALGSGPVFAAVFEWMWERHRLSLRWVVATAIAVSGIALVSTARHADGGADRNVTTGILLGLLAGCAYALYTYASTRAIATGHPGRGVVGSIFGVGAVALFPVLIATGAPLLATAQSTGIAAYLALVPMFLAYLLFGFGLRAIRSTVATTVTLIEPFIATILAVVVVGERLNWSGWLGLVLIILGVAVLVSARRGGKAARSF